MVTPASVDNRRAAYLAAVCVMLPLTLAGSCVPSNDETTGPAAVEFGFTDEGSGDFVPVAEGEVMPLFTGGQGGSHIFVTLRASGFPIDSDGKAGIVVAEIVSLADSGVVLHDFTQTVAFNEIGNGQAEIRSRFVFLDALPEDLDQKTAIVDFTLSSAADPSIRAQVSQTIRLDLR